MINWLWNIIWKLTYVSCLNNNNQCRTGLVKTEPLPVVILIHYSTAQRLWVLKWILSVIQARTQSSANYTENPILPEKHIWYLRDGKEFEKPHLIQWDGRIRYAHKNHKLFLIIESSFHELILLVRSWSEYLKAELPICNHREISILAFLLALKKHPFFLICTRNQSCLTYFLLFFTRKRTSSTQ